MIPRPDWFDKPHEEWPESARAFYRLVYIGLRRAQEAKFIESQTAKAGNSDSETDPTRP